MGIIEERKKLKEITNPIYINKSWGFDINWEEFIYGVSLLSPQAYGPRIQARLVKELNLKKVKATEDSGDFVDQFGDNFEFKVSIVDSPLSKMNIVQVRPWQSTSYWCFCFDIRSDEFLPYAFKLSKHQMKNELDSIGANAAHGTKKANTDNKNVEYRFSLIVDCNDAHFKRWLELYKSNFFVNKK